MMLSKLKNFGMALWGVVKSYPVLSALAILLFALFAASAVVGIYRAVKGALGKVPVVGDVANKVLPK